MTTTFADRYREARQIRLEAKARKALMKTPVNAEFVRVKAITATERDMYLAMGFEVDHIEGPNYIHTTTYYYMKKSRAEHYADVVSSIEIPASLRH